MSIGQRSAKMDAAQKVVTELTDRDLLDEYYNPMRSKSKGDATSEDDLPDGRRSSCKNQWTFRDPHYWSAQVAQRYYIHRISTEGWDTQDDGISVTTLLLITKDKPLYQLPAMSFWRRGKLFQMVCTNLLEELYFDQNELHHLKSFTERLFKIVVNKSFCGSIDQHVCVMIVGMQLLNILGIFSSHGHRSCYCNSSNRLARHRMQSLRSS